LLLFAPLLWAGCAASPTVNSLPEVKEPPQAKPKERATVVPASTRARPEGCDEEDLNLHLVEAIDRALDENPDIHIAAARIAQAEAGLAEAHSAWKPTLGAEFSYLRADAPSMYLFKTIDAGQFLPGTNFNDPGAFSNWEAGIGLGYNLYNGGRDRLQEQIAEDGIELEKLQRSVVKNALAAAVIDAWYGVREAEEQILTARASVTTTEAQVGEAKVRFEEGRSLRTDLLSLQVRQAEAEEMLIRAKNGRELALAALGRLLGLDAKCVLTLVGPGLEERELPPRFEEALDLAILRRPELAQARRSVDMAEREVERAEAGIMPSADLFARGWYDSPDIDFEDSRENWAVGISLNWSFYDAGRRGAGIDRSRARLDEMRRADHQAMLAVQLDVKSSWVRLQDAKSRLEVSGTAVSTSEETLQLVQEQYDAGAVTVTRYLEAEWMTTEARMRRTNAAFDLEKARAGLARALGEFGITSEIEEETR
jgi:outer membrane protein